MSIEIILSFLVTMIISTILMPCIIKVGKKLDIVAHMNNRTVHKKEIVRIGGYGVFIATMIGALIFLKTDPQINAILIAGFLIFFVGLIDDVHDLSPKLKLLVECVAALIVIIGGNIYLKGFDFLPHDLQMPISGVVTLLWIVGITNAINLIDGLDGLSSGISIIVLFTISMTSILSGRSDIAALALVLAGGLMGFLFYNFHPAKVFLGDCGALYVGFMISVISLLGFGYSVTAFFTLGAPIVVLMVPILDTLIAIIRRKVHHKSFSEADRKHLHHNLMFKLKLGHRKSVLVLYAVTFLFSLTSYVYYYDATIGIIMFIILMLGFEIFIETTDMISRKYKPVLTIFNVFIHSDKLPKIKIWEEYRLRRTPKMKKRDHILMGLVAVLAFSGCIYYVNKNAPMKNQLTTEIQVPYKENKNDNTLLSQIYNRLSTAYENGDKEEECQLVGAYFVCDYFTIKGKDENVVGGLDYFYPDLKANFQSYALKSFYASPDYKKLEVKNYKIVSFTPSKVTIPQLEDKDYYDVLITYEFNKKVDDFQASTNVTLVYTDNRYYVVGIDNA